MAHPREFAEGLSIGIIMDGNGRWATKRGLPRTVGHKAGAETFRRIATYCKEIGVKKVIAKAENLKHKMVLERVGADEVVIPEMEMGEKMGARLANPLLHDIMTISSKYSIIEMELPSSWAGSSLVTLDIRKKYDVNVLAVERDNDVIVNFAADEPLLDGDTLLVGGSREMLDLLQNQYN